MRVLKYILAIMIVWCFCNSVFAADYTQPERAKSTVLLVINNMARSKHDVKLNKIMDEELHKKIDGIYKEESSEQLRWHFLGRDCSNLREDQIAAKLSKSKSDYLIYAQLNGLDKKTKYNLIYHGKKVIASFYIRLYDIKRGKDLYFTEYQLAAEDTTDYFFIGSGSVSRKALHSVLFRAGEVISAHLPL